MCPLLHCPLDPSIISQISRALENPEESSPEGKRDFISGALGCTHPHLESNSLGGAVQSHSCP